MGQSWWNFERQRAYQKAAFRCEACGVHKQDAMYHPWLEAHETYDIDWARGTMTFVRLVALCHACHNYIHSGRMEMLVEAGEMSEEKQQEIIRHGDKVIQAAALKAPKPYRGKIAPWDKWRMIFEGKEYKGLFPNQAAWEQHYSGLDD